MARHATAAEISSEWFFAKALQILDEAPELYDRAERLIEAADWVVWQLTGVETRNTLHRGLQGDVVEARRVSRQPAYFAALDPRFEHVVDEKMSRTLLPPGSGPAVLTERAAALTGLRAGTPVAVANVDAHVSAPAATRDRARIDGRDHGDEQLPHPPRRASSPIRRGHVRRRSRTASSRG